MKIEIKNRLTNAVIFSGEFEGFKDALTSKTDLRNADLSSADLSSADLSSADLGGANLSGAYLSKTNLSKTNLSKANLRGADLSSADLSSANLSGANLRWANLSGANLRWANLSKTNLSKANLRGADLSSADLSSADLSDADLSGAYLSGATGLPEIEKIAIKDAICSQVCTAPENLEMKNWHTCGSQHCIAGWATILHPQGRELEEKLGTSAAAALIFNACEGYVPNFHSDNETALRWLRGEIERN